jgi:hypothetical protein
VEEGQWAVELPALSHLGRDDIFLGVRITLALTSGIKAAREINTQLGLASNQGTANWQTAS